MVALLAEAGPPGPPALARVSHAAFHSTRMERPMLAEFAQVRRRAAGVRAAAARWSQALTGGAGQRRADLCAGVLGAPGAGDHCVSPTGWRSWLWRAGERPRWSRWAGWGAGRVGRGGVGRRQGVAARSGHASLPAIGLGHRWRCCSSSGGAAMPVHDQPGCSCTRVGVDWPAVVRAVAPAPRVSCRRTPSSTGGTGGPAQPQLRRGGAPGLRRGSGRRWTTALDPAGGAPRWIDQSQEAGALRGQAGVVSAC